MSTYESVPLLGSASPHQNLEEKKKRTINLYRAALRGDWKYVIDSGDITAKISERDNTALHIGAMGKSCEFARKLLPELRRIGGLEDLVVRNKLGNTAFFLAAASGKLELAKEMIEAAEKMVEKKKYGNLANALKKRDKYGNSDEEVDEMKKNGKYLAQLKGYNDKSPLLVAVLYCREEMVYWLYYLTRSSLIGDDRIRLFLALIRNGFHELALRLVEEDKELAVRYREIEETDDETEETEEAALHALVQFPVADQRGSRKKIKKKDTALYALAQLPVADQQGSRKKIKKKDTALLALAQLPVANQQGVWKRIKRCFNRYYTLQLLEKYEELGPASDRNEETISNQQGLWKKVKNRFLCSIEKLSPEMRLVQRVWEKAITSHLQPQDEEKLQNENGEISNISEVAREPIFVAAERGNIEFLKILIREYPDLIFLMVDDSYSIFHFAVKCRHVDIFRLIHEIGSFKDFIVAGKDKKGNSILHLAGMLAPLERLHSVSGVALQMQQELLWFEEVKKHMNPLDVEAKNVDRKTPRALFSEQHKKLKEDGEKWMKDTANYCMVVAALITTMVFAATLAVPGGTNDETGTPHFLKKSSFKIFIVSDAISLVLSSCSILTFLSILTSRYAEEDFLEPLPRKLLFGLGTLLLSIAAMMVVFCAAIFILFKDGVVWIPILVAAIASLPVIFFIIQQVYLFIVVLRSTYISSFIFKPGNGTLFS